MATRLVRTSDILDGHVSLDIECLGRIYLNGYVPNLQVGGQVVQFLAVRGFPIPSPAVVNRIGERFRESVRRFAEGNHIPVIRFKQGDPKIAVMQRFLSAQAATGRSGVAAIGLAQEFQRVATCTTRAARNGGAPHFAWHRAERRVSVFYFYLWMRISGRGSSRSRRISRTRSRSGSTDTSGPSSRARRMVSGARRWPTASPPAPIRPGWRRSVTGSVPPRSGCSSNARWRDPLPQKGSA
jgi:hypothetical protein